MKPITFALMWTLLSTATITATEWQPIRPPDTLQHRGGHATAYDPFQDKLYVFGGSVHGYENTAQRYDPVTDTWEMLAPMPSARAQVGAVRVRDRIYVPGGYWNGTVLDVNEAYDIAADTWITCAPLPTAALAYVIGTYRDSLIYVCGGFNPGVPGGLDIVQIYCPAANSWSHGTRMPRVGDMGGGVIIGDTIYITSAYNRATGQSWPRMLRGYIHPDDPTRIDWHEGPDVPVPGWGPATSAGRTAFAWYRGSQGHPSSCWIYDTQTGTIDMLPSLPDSFNAGSIVGEFLLGRTGDRPELYILGGQTDTAWPAPYLKLDLSAFIGVEEGKEPIANRQELIPTIIRGSLSLPAAGMTNDQFPMTMLDASGRKVMDLQPGENDVRHLGPGVYFLRSGVEGNREVHRFIIAR